MNVIFANLMQSLPNQSNSQKLIQKNGVGQQKLIQKNSDGQHL